jgi:hypothetical protein
MLDRGGLNLNHGARVIASDAIGRAGTDLAAAVRTRYKIIDPPL